MLFKKAFHLLIDNFRLNYKLLLYKVIVAVITIALCAGLLYPTLHMLFTSEPFLAVAEHFVDFFKALVSGDTAFLNTFADTLQGKLSALLSFIHDKTPNFVFFFVSLAVIVLVGRFLDGMGNFVFGCLVDDKMSSYAKTPFSGAYISNLGKAALWQVVYVPVTFVYDALIIALCYVFFLILLNVISFGMLASVFALMFSVALLLASQAVKLTLFNDVAPALVSDKMKLRDALKTGFSYKKERFGTLFSTYLVTSLIVMCVNVLCALATFGAALLITLPMSYLMFTCIQYVSYYDRCGKKYFLAEDSIVLPKKDKNEDNFYDNFEI